MKIISIEKVNNGRFIATENCTHNHVCINREELHKYIDSVFATDEVASIEVKNSDEDEFIIPPCQLSDKQNKP